MTKDKKSQHNENIDFVIGLICVSGIIFVLGCMTYLVVAG